MGRIGVDEVVSACAGLLVVAGVGLRSDVYSRRPGDQIPGSVDRIVAFLLLLS